MKNIALIFTFLMLIGCGPSHEECIKMIEDDYSVLDNDTIKIENDLLTQMVAEEERLLNIANAANIRNRSAVFCGYRFRRIQHKWK